MDLPARRHEALAHPTSARVFSVLVELRRSVGTFDLSQRLGMHPNGVRVHLVRLSEAGLVARKRSRQARGRPRDMWSIAPDAQPGGDPPGAYADLGRWLARVLSSRSTSLRAVEATGVEIGRDLAPSGDAGQAEERMHAALAALGFRPTRHIERRGRLTYRLLNCPYREVARENQPAVCALHRGMTRGLLDVIAPSTKLAAFVPRDPYAAGCEVELRGGLTEEILPADPEEPAGREA